MHTSRARLGYTFDAMIRMLLGAGHLLMAEWNNSVGRPCHYVAADLANHCIVVAIRYASHALSLERISDLMSAHERPGFPLR